MKSPVAHWGSREWRKNTDDLVPDPARPQAFREPDLCLRGVTASYLAV